jgi:hypothetical protein
MVRSLIIALVVLPIASPSYSLAWNKKHKEGYSLTQYISPSKYTSKSSYSSISSINRSYKSYIEYGIASSWMIVLDFEKTDIHDMIAVDTIYPNKVSYRFGAPYYKYSGGLMLSYQIARDDFRALSAQVGYKSGEYTHANKGKYNSKYEEVSLGISQGISRAISNASHSYIEFRYAPSFYHKVKVYCPETSLNLGLNLNDKVNIEIGLLHKMNKVYIKDSPYKTSPEDFPHHFKYLESDVNSLLRFKSYKDIITTHCKLSYQLSKKHGIELGIFNSSNSASENSMTYSIGYIMKW